MGRFNKLRWMLTFACVPLQTFAIEPVISSENLATAVDEVVVVGRRPGPPLWRVINGDNTLYVFGTFHPLPAKFEWDPTAIEHILTQASAFLDRPGVEANTSNPLTIVSVMRKLSKLKRIKGDKRLEDLLPASLRRSLATLLERHGIPYRKIARLQPLFAAEELQDRISKKVGFAKNDRITKHIRKLVRKNDVAIIESAQEMELDTALLVMEKLPLGKQVDCLATTVQAFHDDIPAAMERAHAWIAGDSTLLKQFDYPDTEHSCSDPFYLVPEAQEAIERSESFWLKNAALALEEHRITVAVLPIREVIHPNGLLVKLVNKGYDLGGQ